MYQASSNTQSHNLSEILHTVNVIIPYHRLINTLRTAITLLDFVPM